MRFFRFVFSKFILIALSILLEVALLVISVTYFNTFFNWVRVLSYVIGMIVFLHLINRKQNPELKLPWLFLLVSVPLIASMLYIMLTNSKMTKFQAKNYNQIYDECSKILNEKDDKKCALQGNNQSIDTYLGKQAHTMASGGNQVKYFKNGMLFFEDLLSELRLAKKFIFMEYFIINYGYMWDEIHKILVEKVKEGVEVRVLYDDFGTIGKLKNAYYKKLRKEGIQARKFNTFTPIISGVHNNRDHRKITIIDGNVGFTGGINISDEYINKVQPYGVWKDTAIKIKGAGVTNMTIMFLQMYDIESKARLNYSKYLDISNKEYKDDVAVNFFGSGPAPFYKDQVGENNFINMINSAKKSVYITTPYLIIDYYLKTAIKLCASKNIDVRIITPHIPDKKFVWNITRSNYKELMEAGVKIYEYAPGFIHSKQVIIDGEIAFVGTINFDYRSLVHHYECGAVIYNSDIASTIQNDFLVTQNESIEITSQNFKMNKFVVLCNAMMALFVSLL